MGACYDLGSQVYLAVMITTIKTKFKNLDLNLVIDFQSHTYIMEGTSAKHCIVRLHGHYVLTLKLII